MKVTDLFKNEWVSLKKITDPDKGVGGYVYSHETRCKGSIISMLPFKSAGEDELFLLRNEITPCWGRQPFLSTFTGGREDDDPAEDASRELAEEAGYIVNSDKFIYLGQCKGTKSTDTTYELFTVDLTGFSLDEDVKSGDGSKLEAMAYNVWRPRATIEDCQDPLVSVIYTRMQKYL